MSRFTVILIVAAVCVAAIGYMAMQPVIPPPIESLRVRHPSGFSMIFPAGWDTKLGFAGLGGFGTDSIEGALRKTEGRPGSFRITAATRPASENELLEKHYAQERLDGQPVWVFRHQKPGDDEHSIEYQFPRGGRWFHINITRPLSEPIDVPPWTDYLKSLRVDAPATQPGAQ